MNEYKTHKCPACSEALVLLTEDANHLDTITSIARVKVVKESDAKDAVAELEQLRDTLAVVRNHWTAIQRNNSRCGVKPKTLTALGARVVLKQKAEQLREQVNEMPDGVYKDSALETLASIDGVVKGWKV